MSSNSFWPYLPNGTPVVDTSTLSEGASSMGIRTPDFQPTTPEHQTRAYYDYHQYHNSTTSGINNNPHNAYDHAPFPIVNSTMSATPVSNNDDLNFFLLLLSIVLNQSTQLGLYFSRHNTQR